MLTLRGIAARGGPAAEIGRNGAWSMQRLLSCVWHVRMVSCETRELAKMLAFAISSLT